jgi:hypothetical protein
MTTFVYLTRRRLSTVPDPAVRDLERLLDTRPGPRVALQRSLWVRLVQLRLRDACHPPPVEPGDVTLYIDDVELYPYYRTPGA